MARNTYPILSPSDLDAIHDTSMAILSKVGIAFHNPEAVNVFRQHGIRAEGSLVYPAEKQVMEAIANAPSRFTIRARNPARDVVIGGDKLVFAPGYGAPYLMDISGNCRKPAMDDYHRLMKLVDALPNQDMSGHMLALPDDVPEKQVHLAMLHSAMLHSDKPFIGSTNGPEAAIQTMEMCAILFGLTPDELKKQPVTAGLVDSFSPLSYSQEMAGAILTYARWRQPLIVAALVMSGATGPVTLAGSLAQQNAELLAGITLAQLVNPGTPVIYSSASTNMDLRTGMLAIGSPELGLMSAASTQLAHFYGLPGRTGGALTDAHYPDAQAGAESMFGLLAGVNSGGDFVLHAAGILSSFLAFSFEKMVLDDDLCGQVRHFANGLEVTPETLAYDVIERVGPGGNYLREAHTLRLCRQAFWQPDLAPREDMETWLGTGGTQAVQRAKERWLTLVAEHRAPPMDELTRRQLASYTEKNGLVTRTPILPGGIESQH